MTLSRGVLDRSVAVVACVVLASTEAAAEPVSLRYINGVIEGVEATRRDLPRLTRLAEKAAGKLLAGGELVAPAVAPWWASELSGRAGGPMRVLRNATGDGAGDVALFALPHPALATLKTAAALQEVLSSRASLYVLGPSSMVADYQTADGKLLGGSQRLACLGGPPIGAGLFPRENLPPLAPYRPVIEMVRGWTFIGEVVDACTRQGKMPTIWQSIALPGSRARNASIKLGTGPRAGQFPMFHADRHVAAMAPGAAGRQYLDAIARYLRGLRGQGKQLVRAGQWMTDALRSGRRVVAMAQGHAPSLIVGRDNETKLPIDLYAGGYDRAVVPHAKPGDTVVALCYMEIPVDAVLETLAKGCKVVIACPYGLPAKLESKPGLLWLDTGWQVGDAAVTVPGYDVKMLPASAVMQMSTLYALVAEMAARDQAALRPSGSGAAR